MDQVQPFFAIVENLKLLNGFLNKIASIGDDLSDNSINVVPYLERLIRAIVNEPSAFDQYCVCNIRWVGNNFLSLIRNYSPIKDDSSSSIVAIFSCGYRFLCEFRFSIPSEISTDLLMVTSFVENNISNFSGTDRGQLTFALYVMPAQMLREMLHNPDIANARKLNEMLSTAKVLTDQWDETIRVKEKEVGRLSAQLDEFKVGFNFVGLVNGFNLLKDNKNKERKWNFFFLLVLAVLAISPVSVELYYVIFNSTNIEEHKSTLLFALPALITLEVILVYFFRVVLAHFRSIKAQLLQLELRTALCQFIQSYTEYSAPIKRNDPSALDKFESLIFSGLISNEEQLPSTFDGSDQIAKLIKSLRP